MTTDHVEPTREEVSAAAEPDPALLNWLGAERYAFAQTVAAAMVEEFIPTEDSNLRPEDVQIIPFTSKMVNQ